MVLISCLLYTSIVELKIPGTLYIYADEVKIGQVITNFLTNALKHTSAGQHITIQAYRKPDEETMHFEIRDDGEGIPESELPYVWDRYHKTSRSFSRNQLNTGLGLAIVKAILDAHDEMCIRDRFTRTRCSAG